MSPLIRWEALGISVAGEVVLVEAKAHIYEIFSHPSIPNVMFFDIFERLRRFLP